MIARAESWVIEESEVDPVGKTLRCRTKNLEFTKVMQVEETVTFNATPDGYVQRHLVKQRRLTLAQ